MTTQDLREFKTACERAGLVGDWEELSLLAIKLRQAKIAFGEANQSFIEGKKHLCSLADKRGIFFEGSLDPDEVANLLA